jgi:hypothetical protein
LFLIIGNLGKIHQNLFKIGVLMPFEDAEKIDLWNYSRNFLMENFKFFGRRFD